MAFRTAAQAINDAARALGFGTADVADPYASTNPLYLQLTTLLNEVGQELLNEHPWADHTKNATITTANGTSEYALASDFGEFVDGSLWNQTTGFPLEGPITNIQYQALLAHPVTLTVSSTFLPVLSSGAKKILIYPTPTATETVGYSYKSAWWMGTGATGATGSRCTAKTDVVYFDSLLVTRALKVKMAQAKGMDTATLEAEYRRELEKVKGLDPAPRLSLLGQTIGVRRIDRRNFPDTGFGS